jgi:hypothetical protein
MEHFDEQNDGAMHALREANPVTAQKDDESRERLFASITAGTGSAVPGDRSKLMLAGAGALGVVVAGVVVGAVVLANGGDGRPGENNAVANPGETGGGLSASCIGFSPVELQMRQFAFEGTVVAIDEERITFAVDRNFSGETNTEVTLNADSTLLNEMYTDFEFVVGERYLVSGDDEFAWGCGFTVPHSDEMAAEWEAILDAPVISPGGAAASCAFAYNLESLRERDHAFDGVVVSIEPGTGSMPGGEPVVTFEVREWFKGPGGETITLRSVLAVDGDGVSLSPGSGPVLTVGERYLVSGDDVFAWSCDFTHEYDEAMAEQWRAAFE